MQDIIVEKPFKFVPPRRGNWWPRLVVALGLYEPHLRKKEGVVDHACRPAERLRASLDAGHGILLTPNHCRTADPTVMGWLANEARTNVFAMASWHLFNRGWFMAWAIRSLGAFSVNREGIDRQAMTTAVEILAGAERPLVIFAWNIVMPVLSQGSPHESRRPRMFLRRFVVPLIRAVSRRHRHQSSATDG